MRSDGDDPGARFPAIPFIPDFDIHSLADDLEDDPPARLFGGVNHALASVDAGRQLARRFPQRFQGKGRLRFVAPRPEGLRVVVPMVMGVMPAIGIVAVGTMTGLAMGGVVLEREGSNRPTDNRISSGTLPPDASTSL